MNKIIKKQKGFTLIELLIVIGILAILIVITLLAMNPGQAQKRARDAQRIKDMNTLSIALSQYLGAGNYPIAGCIIGPTGCTSVALTNATKQPCDASNFLGIDLCPYLSAVPLDPINGQTGVVMMDNAVVNTYEVTTDKLTLVGPAGFHYDARIFNYTPPNASPMPVYEIRTHLETLDLETFNKVVRDGGDDRDYFEVANSIKTLL